MSHNFKLCPCCSGKDFLGCCQPFLEGDLPKTALQLMRSRYTAYSLGQIDYIQKTMFGSAAEGFDAAEAKQWAESIRWCGLTIIHSGKQVENTSEDSVEFIARYLVGSALHILHEKSQFEKKDGYWFYTSGCIIPEPVIKVNHKGSCPCGSRRKFYLCCGTKEEEVCG